MEGEEPSQLEVRGLFPNVDGLLLPDQDVDVTLVRRGRESEKLLVPQIGVQRDWRGSFVLIVGEANRVERRRITTRSRRGDLRIVEDGLLVGERVIVGGAEGVRPRDDRRPDRRRGLARQHQTLDLRALIRRRESPARLVLEDPVRT